MRIIVKPKKEILSVTTINKASFATYRRTGIVFIVFICSIFCFYGCSSDIATKTEDKSKAEHESKALGSDMLEHPVNNKIQHPNDWREVSFLADSLIDNKMYDQAEKMLNNILPKAKKEAPKSLDYALALCRLGSDLYALDKCPLADARLQESISILDHLPTSERQRHTLWRAMGTESAVLLSLKKYAQAEAMARKSVAYAIAFPDVATPKQLKIAYSLLFHSLVKQRKFTEAVKIKEIMNQ
jgi:tetratricopeptide (TPR) repeat protein